MSSSSFSFGTATPPAEASSTSMNRRSSSAKRRSHNGAEKDNSLSEETSFGFTSTTAVTPKPTFDLSAADEGEPAAALPSFNWLQMQAIALGCTSEALGGFGVVRSFTSQDEVFPTQLTQLLDCFPSRGVSCSTTKASPSKLYKNQKSVFIERASERLDLSVDACTTLVDRFMNNLGIAQISAKIADGRKRDILKSIESNPRKLEVVSKILKDVHSLAELDAIESVVGLMLKETMFEETLMADLKLARETCQEIVFGVTVSDDLLDQVEARYQREKCAILQTVLLMARCCNDTNNDSFSNAEWHSFASFFIPRHVDVIENKVFELLARKLSSKEESLLLKILFYLPVESEEGLLLRMVQFGKAYVSRIPWVARIMQLLSNLHSFSDSLNDAIQSLHVPVVLMCWAIHTQDVNIFSQTYQSGFEYFERIKKHGEFGFVLQEYLESAVANFAIDERLEHSPDYEFIAGLCTAAFRGRQEACDAFWRQHHHPLRQLLDKMQVFPTAYLEFCGALVSGENSANYALAYLGENVSLDSLALFQNLIMYLDKRTLLERFDIMKLTRLFVRNHKGDPHLVKTLGNLSRKFPQQVLTVIINEPDSSSFSVLEVIRRNLEVENSSGEYENLLAGLELICSLLKHVERERCCSELRLAFGSYSAEGSPPLDKKQLLNSLAVLGYTAGIDDASFAKVLNVNGTVDYPKFELLLKNKEGCFFRVLSLSLKSRRGEIDNFVFQAVKIVREIYRSHGGWKYVHMKQYWRIGVITTKLLHSFIKSPAHLESIREKVADDLMNDMSTRQALVGHMLSVKRNSASQELTYVSLDLLNSLLNHVDGFYAQKMGLLCQTDLTSCIASYIGYPNEQEGDLLCKFPFPTLAVTVLESFIHAMDVTRSRQRNVAIPSIVAMLNHAPFLQDDVVQLVRNEEISIIWLLTTALEVEPGLAAMLLQKEELIKAMMSILSRESNFEDKPELYCAVVEFLGVLWYKGYRTIIAKLLELFPEFWTMLSYSLRVDVGATFLHTCKGDETSSKDLVAYNSDGITKHCCQFNIRAWALEIMTVEMEKNGVTGKFMNLLREFQKNDRDRAWLEQYPIVSACYNIHKPSIMTSSSATQIRLDCFEQLCPDFSCTSQRRMRRSSVKYIYDTERLTQMFPAEKKLIEQVKETNIYACLADAQLLLLTSWKTYMETRCLIMWEDETLTEVIGGTGDNSASPVINMENQPKALRRGRTLSTISSKHWGDVTSYTLIVELASHLKQIDPKGFNDEHQQVCAMQLAEMFLSMLHFKIFEPTAKLRDKLPQSMANPLLSIPVHTEEHVQHFRKRSQEMRGEKLALCNDSDPKNPGVVQLIRWILSCLSNLVKTRMDINGHVEQIIVSLLSGLLLLFGIAADDENSSSFIRPADSPSLHLLGEERQSALDVLSAILKRWSSDVAEEKGGDDFGVLDVCIPLLNLLLVNMAGGKSKMSTMSQSMYDNDVFKVLHKMYCEYSEKLAKEYVEQHSLCIWFQQNGLSDLRVKILGGSSYGSTSKSSAGVGSGPKKKVVLVEEKNTPTTRDDKEEEDNRLREVARRLGYRGLDMGRKNKHYRNNYRDIVNRKGFSSVGSKEDGMKEVSAIHLLFDFGVTSIENLRILDHEALLNLGIYKQSDRRRLLDIIKDDTSMFSDGGSGDGENRDKQQTRTKLENDMVMNESRDKQHRRFSRQIGFRKRQKLKRGLERMELILRVFSSAARIHSGFGNHAASFNLVGTLVYDPVLRAVSSQAFPASMDNRDNSATITFRGYTVQGERDIGHLVWCQALRLVGVLVGSSKRYQENKTNVEQALDFMYHYRGSFIGSLQACRRGDSVLTLGMLEEVNEVCSVLREMANHIQRWRLRGQLYGTLLKNAWFLLNDLIVGNDASRRTFFLEEFVRTFFTQSRAVPKLCISTRAITVEEAQQDQRPVMESLQKKPAVGVTPRSSTSSSTNLTVLLRSGSIITDLSKEEEESKREKEERGSTTSTRPLAVVSQLAEGDISVLHVNIEYHICRILQQLLSLLRNKNVVKVSKQLQVDEHSKQELPARYWGKAFIPFPFLANADEIATTVDDGGTSPSVATLVSLLGYCKYRLHLSVNVLDNAPSSAASASSSSSLDNTLSHASSPYWRSMLKFLMSNGFYLLLVSLELGLHEKQRLECLTAQQQQQQQHQVADVEESVLVELKSKVRSAMDKYEQCFKKIGNFDEEMFDFLKERLTSVLERYDTRIAHKEKVPRGPVAVVSDEVTKRRKKSLLAPASSSSFVVVNDQAEDGVVIWLYEGGTSDEWEAVFRNFGIDNVRFILVKICQNAPSEQQDGDESVEEEGKGIVCWYRNGESIQPVTGSCGPTLENNLSSVLGLENAQHRVQLLLSDAQDKTKRTKALQELFALISCRNENTQEILSAAGDISRLVRSEASVFNTCQNQTNVIIGGFQEGGSIAMLTSLMLSYDSREPFQVDGCFAINSYLPLSNAISQGLIANKKLTTPIFMRNGDDDKVVTPLWAELTARSLHLSGLKVNFETTPGLGHGQWDIDQMAVLRDFIKTTYAGETPKT